MSSKNRFLSFLFQGAPAAAFPLLLAAALCSAQPCNAMADNASATGPVAVNAAAPAAPDTAAVNVVTGDAAAASSESKEVGAVTETTAENRLKIIISEDVSRPDTAAFAKPAAVGATAETSIRSADGRATDETRISTTMTGETGLPASPAATGKAGITQAPSGNDGKPPLVNELMMKAGSEFSSGRMKDAIPYLLRYLELEPDDLKARMMLCQAALWGGDPRGAVVYLKDYLRRVPDDIVAVQMLCKATLWGGDPKGAITVLRDYIKRVPGDLEARLMLCQATLWGGNPKGAASLYAKYFAMGGARDAAALHQYAESLRASERTREALSLLREARRTAEAELAPAIDLSIGHTLLSENRVSEARSAFERMRGTKMLPEFHEAMGDLSMKRQSLCTEELVFDPAAETFSVRISKTDLAKARKAYERSYSLRPESTNPVQIKIADCMWDAGERERALKLMEKARRNIKSDYVAMRLAHFTRELGGTSEAVLKRCLTLLDEAAALGDNDAEAELSKADIHWLSRDIKNYEVSITRAAKLARGDEWFVQTLGTRLFGVKKDHDLLLAYSRKIAKAKKHPAAAELLSALAFARGKGKEAEAIAAIASRMASGTPLSYDETALAREAFDALPYEIRLANAGIEKAIGLAAADLASNENRRRLAALAKAGTIARGAKELLATAKAEAAVREASGDIAGTRKAVEQLIGLAKSAGDRIELEKAMKRAFTLALAAGDNAGAMTAARRMTDAGIADGDALKYLIYGLYWDGDRGYAQKCIETLRGHEPASPVPHIFDGLGAMERQAPREALGHFRKASRLGGDAAMIGPQISAARNFLAPSLSTGYSFISDSTEQSKYYKSASVTMPGDTVSYNAGTRWMRISKEKMFLGLASGSNTLKEYFIGATARKGDWQGELKLSKQSVDRTPAGGESSFFPGLTITKLSRNATWRASLLRRYVEDTPLSIGLGIVERVADLGVDAVFGKFLASASLTARKLSDGNSRDTRTLGIGRKFHRYMALRLVYSKDRMDHEYAGPTEILGARFAPFEVYYSPNGVAARSLILDYSRAFNKFSLSASTTLYGNEVRAAGPDAKFRNLSLTLDLPLRAGSSFNLSFYGAKSDINPLSDQTTNSTYIDREVYLKYVHKF